MSDEVTGVATLPLMAKIVCAYVRHNSVPSNALPGLIQLVRETLADLAVKEAPEEPLVPAVPIRQSVFPMYLIYLEDGRKLTALKRHLATVYDLTPTGYRLRWGLPDDYPMVAPGFSATRSASAIARGLVADWLKLHRSRFQSRWRFSALPSVDVASGLRGRKEAAEALLAVCFAGLGVPAAGQPWRHVSWRGRVAAGAGRLGPATDATWPCWASVPEPRF